MNRSRPSRRIARRFGFAALALVLFVLGLNVLALAGELVVYGTIYVADRPYGLYEPGLRPRLKPGASLPGLWYSIHVGPMGFRAPNPDLSRTDTTRVWCLGGSTTFDIYAPDDASAWPARLPALLGGALGPVEVVNAGIPGEVLAGNLDSFREWSTKVHPRFVVIYQGPNELRRLAGATPPMGLAGNPWLGALPIMQVLERARPQLSPPEMAFSTRRIAAVELDQLEAQLVRAVDEVQAAGAQPILATHALRAARGEAGEDLRRDIGEAAVLLGLSPSATLAAFEGYNDRIRKVAQERGLPLADVRGAVGPDPANWGDATHFLAPGSALAAAEVARAILSVSLPASAGTSR